jgi:hypothetical protein
MSIHYSLYLAHSSHQEKIQRFIDIDSLEVISIDVPSIYSQKMILEEYRIQVFTEIFLRYYIGSDIDPVITRKNLIEYTMHQIQNTESAEAILIKDGELPIYIFKWWMLFLNPMANYWTEEVLKSLPYKKIIQEIHSL